jgi:hypothetical protein
VGDDRDIADGAHLFDSTAKKDRAFYVFGGRSASPVAPPQSDALPP